MKAFWFVLALGVLSPLGAQDLTVQSVQGLVEYRFEEGPWVPAADGLTGPPGLVVSTGFRGAATLRFSGAAVILGPLTRVAFEGASGDGATLRLLSGTVKVETDSSAWLRLQSSLQTAGARDAGWEFDGQKVVVHRGEVELSDPWGVTRLARPGDSGPGSWSNGWAVQPPPVIRQRSSNALMVVIQ